MVSKMTRAPVARQLHLYETDVLEQNLERSNTTSTFVPQPVRAHPQMFRYSARFSAIWAPRLIEQEKAGSSPFLSARLSCLISFSKRNGMRSISW